MRKIRRKLLACILILVSLFVFTGCVDQKEYDNLVTKAESLEKENEEYKVRIGELENEVNDLNNQIYELNYGATKILIDVRNYFEVKEYSKAIEAAGILHKKYNGTEDDIEGQQIAASAQQELDEIAMTEQENKERIAAEAAKTIEEKIHGIIRVLDIDFSEKSDNGGVSLRIYWRNESEKEIKYITFSMEPYNSVGDKIENAVDGETDSKINCRIVGPIPKTVMGKYLKYKENITGIYLWNKICDSDTDKPYVEQILDGNYYLTEDDIAKTAIAHYWKDVWNTQQLISVKLVNVKIEYMDGTESNITEDLTGYAIW